MRKYLLFAIFTIVSIAISAQEKVITGIVSDETGTLPGVSIIVKGTTNGTESDFDGKYSIKTNIGDKLVFSFVGMKTEEKKVGKSSIINVILKGGNLLDEVVVTAMSVKRERRSLGYSVSSISSQQIGTTSHVDIAKTLSGKATGVQITNHSGNVDSNKRIMIRDAASISNQNQPLYIVDGVPLKGNSKKIQKLKPGKIKSVKVLKDAGELGSNHSVTALYEVIPKGSKSKFLKDVEGLKYTNNASINNYDDELLTVKFRYKEPKGTQSIEMVHVMKDDTINFESASTDFKFATAVALFGMKLRNSKHSNSMSYNDIFNIASQSRGKDVFGYRAEFTRLVKMASQAN